MWNYIFSVDFLWWIIIFLYVPSCIGLIVLVLLQKGKGVGFAGAFGMGAGSEAVFGPRSARSLPQRLTYTMAGLFMLLALIMSTLSGKVGRGSAPETADETAAIESATMESASINKLLDATPTDAGAISVSTTETDTETDSTQTPGTTDTPDDNKAPAELP